MNKKDIIKFIKFSIVGISNALVSLTSFYLLFELAGVNYIVASILSYLIGLANSYFWNLKWTFRHQHSKKVLLKFIAVNIIALSVKLSVISLLVEIFGIYALYSEVIAMFCGFLVNFSGNKFWTFRKK